MTHATLDPARALPHPELRPSAADAGVAAPAPAGPDLPFEAEPADFHTRVQALAGASERL